MSKNKTINVKGTEIIIFNRENQEYISITDIARFKNAAEPKDVVKNWMRSRNTIEFLGLWEKIHNPKFKGAEFDSFLFQAGSNSFVLSPSKWIETTNAIGIISKVGSGGGIYAHHDIALEFASWVSAEFKLYLLLEFQRLKSDENNRLQLEWNLQRTLSKVNYHIHTDAIERNMRDNATIEQLVVLSNLESINSVLIHQGLPQNERLTQLNNVAVGQMKSLLANTAIKQLKE